MLRLPPQNIACNIHAAMTMRFAPRGKPYLRTWQHQITTMKQPFQCNLQPEIQEPHRTTHTGTTTRCKTHRRNNSRTKRPQPQPPHRRGTFHRRLQPLYTEKRKVSYIAHAAMTMQSRSKPAPIYARGTSKDDNEAAIPMQSATRDSRTAWNYAHRNNHSLQNT